MSLLVDAQAAAKLLEGEGESNSSTVSSSVVRSSLLKLFAPALSFVNNSASTAISPAIRRAAKAFRQAILQSRKRKQTKIGGFFKRRDGLNSLHDPSLCTVSYVCKRQLVTAVYSQSQQQLYFLHHVTRKR